MPNHDVKAEFNFTVGVSLKTTMATFTAVVDGIEMKGTVNFRWQSGDKAIYTIFVSNKELSKHPDYRQIRRTILNQYTEASTHSICDLAKQAMLR